MIAIPVRKFVRGWFLNSFLFRNVLNFFLNLFLTTAHQNDLKIKNII